MNVYCKDKKINAQVKELCSLGWRFRRGSKHGKLTAPNGRKLIVASTPGDRRAHLNFRRDVRVLQSV